ncbi:Auxin transport protein BIG [Linum grandiflorum]
MEDHLTKLHRCLFESNSSPTDFLHSLRSDTSITIALQQFYLILKRGVSVVDADDVDDKRLGFQLWTDSQIQAVVSFGLAIVSTSRSLSVTQAEPVVIAVVQQLLEFAVCFLENSLFGNDESSTQMNTVLLMELALVKGIDKLPDQSCSLNCMLELLPVVSGSSYDVQFDMHMKCSLQGFSCLKGEKQVDRLLMTLATKSIQPEGQISGLDGSTHAMSNLIFASQHWIVIHVDCIQRLIPCCKQLIELADVHGEKWASTDFAGRLSFSLRILRLLRSLVIESPYIEYDDSLLQQVASLADAIPSMFRQNLEFVNKQGVVESDFESLAISLVEEFLHLVQLIFCNSSVPQNIKVCIVASILENLDSSAWTYDKSAAIVKPPLVYFPRTIFLILGIIQDVRRAKFQSLGLKELDRKLISSSSESPNISQSCHLHGKEVPLVKRFTVEESLRVIFSSSAKWLDNIMHLILFLQWEGTKLRPKLEKSQSSCLKASCAVEVDNALCHEDEALFGNLFSEGGRSVGSAEVYDQPQVVSSCSNNCNMPMQAASELLGFLKDVVFSQEYRTLYEDGCSMIRENHIIAMLSLLNYQELEDKSFEGFSSSLDERKTWRIHELCFELLGKLLNQHALSASLEQCLVDQILIVENGAFAYSDRALMLLANALFARAGPDGGRLRTRLYEGFLAFIIDRTKNVCSECPSYRELIGALPSVFHMEVLIMAFHLSSTEEKAIQANLISSTLQAVGGPSASFSSLQLSCWGLLVSRLILLLRHILMYPDNCPSSLLLDLRSKLRDGALSGQLSECVSEELLSWASVAAKSVLGAFVEDDPSVSCLMNQLIDIPSLPPSVCRNDLAINSLSLSSNNLRDTFLRIMGFWKGRRASAVEDLLVERYIFFLCSDISMKSRASNNQVSIWSELGDIDMSNVTFLFNFSHVVLGCSVDDVSDNDLQAVILSILKHLSAVNIPQDVEELGWDFFRSSLGLSLILSLVNAGVTRHEYKNKVSEFSAVLVKCTTHDMQYGTVAEQLVSSLISSNQIVLLVELLSSLLKKYLTTHQKAFIATLDTSQYCAEEFSPLSLLKHPDFDKCVLDEILRKCGISYCRLETAFDILLKVDSFVDKAALGNQTKAFCESALHGFPSDLRTPSAVLLSCVISIRDIITILDSLLGLGNLDQKIILDAQVQQEILNSLMIVKFDRIFESLSGKCESIFRNLNPESELSDYSDVYLLTYMEGFLRHLNASEASDSSVLEWLMTRTVDVADSLEREPRKSTVFKSFLGVPDSIEHVKQFSWSNFGDFLVLLDSLDHCSSDSVNVKVLNLFVDILSRESSSELKQRIQTKFLEMDSVCFTKWLETRLLGSVVEKSAGASCAKGSSGSLRESATSFILSLVTSSCEFPSQNLHHHMFESLLALLDNGFLLFDVHIAKSFFHVVIQLCRGADSMKLLLTKTMTLMEKLAGDDSRLPALKFLFGFLETLLSDCGSCTNTLEKSAGNSLHSNIIGNGSTLSKSVGSRKNADAMVLPTNQERSCPAIECDATSADDDEDDGTSDGDVASVDKDDDDDSNNERALASKVCTFTSSGSNFMEQHWYFCYTCDLTVSKGCCSVCAKVCHRGHRVVYSRSSRFFCDCGAGGVRGSNCQCLKPRKLTANDGAPVRAAGLYQSFLPFTDATDQLPETDSDLEEDITTDTDSSVRWPIAREIQDKIPLLIEELDMESQVLQLCSSLLPSVIAKRESELSKNKSIIVGTDKVLSFGAELLQLKKAYKSGSLDLKIKVDYSNTKDLKSHLATGSLVKSLLSVSTRGRLGVGEGDKVAIFDVGQLIGQAAVAPVTADKTNVKPLSRNVVRFEIVQLSFNSATENYLAVAGYEDCQVLTLNPRGEVIDRLSIELALQGAYIRRIDWVPGSQVKLMVVTNRFIKIYDLSQDNISPLHYFTVADDTIVDATLLIASQGIMFLVVLSEQGRLLRHQLPVEGNIGATPLKEIIQIEDHVINANGSSLYYSSTYKLLIVSYHDGTTLMGRLSADAMHLAEISIVYEEEHDGKLRPASLHRWRELLVGSGLFGCFSCTKSNSALAVYVEAHALLAQNMRHATSTTSNLVGLAAYKPLSKDKIHCLVLHDDGSLQIYVHSPGGSDNDANVAAEQVKKLGSGILNSKVYAGLKPEFPLDFFEKTVLITSDVKLGGDAIRNGDSEGAKQSLGSEDGFLEGTSPAGFKISVSNPNPDIVMVGIRVQVGNTSANHIPSEIGIFQRVIKLDEGMRSWYDIPFTVAESLLADEDFVISVGSTFNGTVLPRIDSLEVYGRAKDEFGWKEKMDAVLGMESRVLGSKSSLAVPGKRCRSVESTSVQEQVMADALKFLSKLYPLCQGIEEQAKMESPELKCKMLLETIFESEREPLLQAAACRVLQAIFPSKEKYYQVKDTMRLQGVVKSTSVLLSRLGIGGTTGGWIIEEFTAQMRAVSKIALHRRSNLTNFLDMNGSEVVDGLMLVLWGILDLEQPDTQTMNNIVICAVELIYCYAECLASHSEDAGKSSVAPAVAVLKKLLFYPNEAVQSSSSLAISSRLLQVPFPKQTMLSTDDGVDNSVSASGPGDTSGSVNTQVMIEEDTITSSVQYCCDGCSTVPILRRRWHCTVCPDFDLCEACYQVLDVDRLPPPHSRDHPMTAIPIELESLGGDGSEIHFSTEEVNDSNLLRGTSDIVLQNSAPSIHVLEPNESGEFSAAMTDSVSISASKRAVNSLLLSELLQQLGGWMHTTSGVRAIPIMQLFYRLSSAVGGPFIDGSQPDNLDLEKLITWFLDETDVDQPFPAKTRSSFGEVTILVFMFFTLMLRNWHQPGTDGSSKSTATIEKHDKNVSQATSIALQSTLDSPEKNNFVSQLLRACGSLRNQAFINYLMDILQQLMQVFKSSSGNMDASLSNNGSGCGSLLTVRRDLPAGNFSPFFSDSYAKAHHSDIFMDYHRLLLENAFRLVYTLVRPEKQEKTGDKEKVYKALSSKDLKLDGYQDVLCSYINNPNTTFVRRYARRLFLHICGSKTQYYSIRDSWQFSSEVKKLYKHINKSGSLQSPVPYERSVKIVKCLSTMAEVAAARPRNWQKYCLRHGDALPLFMGAVFYFSEEAVVQTLRLLNLAFYCGKEIGHSQKVEGGETGTSSNKPGSQTGDSKKKKKGEDGIDSSSEKSYLDMEAAVDIFSDKDGDVLRQFVDCFLLEWNLSSVRAEAKCVLYGAWNHGKHSFKEMMLLALLQKVRNLPVYGQNIIEFTELVTWLLGKTPETGAKSTELLDHCLTNEVISGIFDTLHSQNELIANHPNSRIYNTLSGLVEFDGYYLESEPCVACSSPEVPYSRMKLESLKSETKFTDNRIIVKCTGSYTIQSVTMNVHDARKSKSVKVLNLYYNNRPVADLSELKNNWSSWKRAKSCHLTFNQTELKVEFPIPITACNFMIELDSFYENLQALSLEPLQCPRCSRPVTDKHGICSNCHENAYQCRQCRNINYENLDSFLCNECGYSKYGRFEFNFMAKPSFTFDDMENDEDMKRGLTAIESESENAHRRYQQLLGFKKPLLKIVSSIGENEMDSQQKDSVQQMMVSLPGPSCKVNRKIALLGVLYGEKCKAAFDSVSKSVQTLQGLRRVLMSYLHQKHSDDPVPASRFVASRSPNSCYGCATTFITQCLEILQVLSKHSHSRKQLVSAGILSELFENNIHQGPKTAHVQARSVLCAFSEGDASAVIELNSLIQKKVMYCLEHHRSMDIAVATREEMMLLSEVCSLADEFWESRLRIVFQLLFSSIKLGAKHPAIAEHIILPCLRIISQACTPPKPDKTDKEQGIAKSASASRLKEDNSSKTAGSLSGVANVNKSVTEPSEKKWSASSKTHDIQLLSFQEWEKGASYLDFVRRQYKASQAVKSHKLRPQRHEYLALKYMLRWKRRACKTVKGDLSTFELGSWVTELVLSACSQSIRSEMCMLISLLCTQSASRQFRLLNLLVALLPSTLAAGESATEYFELLFKMTDSEDARLFLTIRGCLSTICKLIAQEVGNVHPLEKSLHVDISQGFILHKLIELLGKFLEVPNIRSRFMRDNLLPDILEALIVIRGLVVQKTKLISDCNRLLKDLLDGLLLESSENKRQFIRACISGLQIHAKERKPRTCLFILEQLCNLICPSKQDSVYLLVLNKAHTQEEFIRGSMTKNPYSSAEIGPLMRDVKNKICQQLDLLGLLEDDYGMELLVAGNIISLDLSIAQVYEQVWKKSNSQSSNSMANNNLLSSSTAAAARESPPMTVTYRLQGLDGEATEPMIKELEEDREESQDPEVEFAIAGAVRECGGLEILLGMIQRLRDDLKSNHEQLVAVLNLLMHCCRIRENRHALLKLGALGLLLETARRAFAVDAMEPAEGILLIVESLTLEANESENISITQSTLTVSSEETGTGGEAKKIVLMFLERLCHPLGLKKSNKQQRNTEMVARILPYLTYGEAAAMEALVEHFNPYLQDWKEFDVLQKQHEDNPEDNIAERAVKQRFAVENFVRVSESLKTSSCGERLKDIILEKGITDTAVRHLRESFAIAGQTGFKSTAEWSLGLKLPSVPLILSMLRGLSMGHFATQRCIDEGGVLALLHALEGVSGENEIGARAENLLDTLSNKEGKGDGCLEDKVNELRRATRDEMRRRALRKRHELLQGLGWRQELSLDGGERIVVARPNLEGLDDVEEEADGLACMVCREGYSLRPSDLLGVYTFSKRVNLGASTTGSARGECVYTTVSYFNIIHFQCHQEAKRADAALKNPKKEWEGATLRNNESLCNSLFPIRGPLVPLAQYTRYVDQFWDNLNALGRGDGSRLRLLTYDVVLMLARFATGASFSADCRGGGMESNSRFLPFMIQMARYLFEQGSPSQRRNMAMSISSYINSSPAELKSSVLAAQPTMGTEETVQFMMVNSLLSESYKSWLQHRRAFLQRGIYHAYMQHTHGRSSTARSARPEAGSSSSETDGPPDELLSIIRPMLVYTGLIEQLQQFFKVKKGSLSRREGSSEVVVGGRGGEENEEMEDWELVMKERLLKVRDMVGFSKELVSWLEDMNSATDLQEAFDIIGVLADVLSGGTVNCEDFVNAAIGAGKS